MLAKPGPLLRLVHSLERRRAGRAFQLGLTLRRADTGAPVASAQHSSMGPRAFVVGAGDRVDLAVLGADATASTPRQVAIIAVPRAAGVYLRVVSLHAERGLQVAALDAPDAPHAPDGLIIGGALARDGLRLLFDGYTLDVRATLESPPAPPRAAAAAHSPQMLASYSLGQQLAFYAGASVRSVGNAMSSVAGPGGGGHAIPALVHGISDPPGVGGTLVLRTRIGVHRVEVTEEELQRGLLIGRSRRCVLGRGFDENDGLSRVHALVLGLEEGVFAFDLASRYGLRDVSRPSRTQATSRLDDGVGCLVYGAGYLTCEP